MYQLQLLLNIPELFTSQSKIDFYSSMLKNLDLSSIPEFPSSSPGRKGYSHLPSYWTFCRFINEFSHDLFDLYLSKSSQIILDVKIKLCLMYNEIVRKIGNNG
ncbi:MAG: hypothetical protein XD37_1701 [Thermoanaerobacter thermocopriae]|jgi:hypothetical protein|nr:MAG: hypothetical protein XD37_1701 [Thermoanaerobacter thermocopriae]MBZ4656704.1 transposase family protein [Thermoanaerobacter sp.]